MKAAWPFIYICFCKFSYFLRSQLQNEMLTDKRMRNKVYYTECLKKRFTNLKEHADLYREHAQRFEPS
jgi:hypothetical protein